MRRVAFPVVLAVTASACVAPRQPAPPPPAAAAPAPRPAQTAAIQPSDWRDRAYSPGDWSYDRNSGLSAASYGAVGAPRLTLACDPCSWQLRLLWSNVPAGPVSFRTTYGDTARQAQAWQGGVQITLTARDPLLDQIAYSRGRFMLAAGGAELILPAWPELARVIEDCR